MIIQLEFYHAILFAHLNYWIFSGKGWNKINDYVWIWYKMLPPIFRSEYFVVCGGLDHKLNSKGGKEVHSIEYWIVVRHLHKSIIVHL